MGVIIVSSLGQVNLFRLLFAHGFWADQSTIGTEWHGSSGHKGTWLLRLAGSFSQRVPRRHGTGGLIGLAGLANGSVELGPPLGLVFGLE